ncbi:cytochrome c maturation protein CcmE [Fulvivirgaceae bacterium BMA10]|uniref:Cytochrome c maturation protein CcmE n=1 Tax=Splendidivirga corallicola TaxID=3051826 RepID=A0ABT8KLQ4_9BACT|nr:cytochrome c maturation protein CcmE [Fulvivirgaceae bacterium BMA10]
MKTSYIFGLVIIAVAVAIIISTAGDASSYVTFKDAKEMAENGDESSIHVVGQLKKNEHGKVVGIQPSQDKLSVTFVLVDENGQEQRVFYKEPMPTDLMKSENVVVIGSYKNDIFMADKLLLKCPSKYQEESISISEAN